MEYQAAGIIPPQQLAHIRAQVHAHRAVSSQDVARLLEAYDELARQLREMAGESNARAEVAAAA